jgi:phage terminase large subunit-like protein
VFREDLAARAAGFFPRFLTHVKGRQGRFVLEPWQETLVREIFGWVHHETGLRRYRTVYCEVPRKNGKTTLAAGIMLYMLLVDREQGAEVYSAATTRDQAGVVYEIASQMVSNHPTLKKRCRRLDSRKRLVAGKSYFQSCSSEAGAIHGTNPHCVIFDELHEQPDRELWTAFRTGFGSRRQPLFFSITTAGYDRTSLCWEQHQYAKAILAGDVEDDRYLPVIFAADDTDDWREESTWEKANPCLDVSLHRDFLRSECATAQEIPGLENSFRRLHLNQWTEQDRRYIPMHKWDACRTSYKPDSLRRRPCYAGVDLATTRDVTACVLVFPEDDGGFKVLPFFWLPQDSIDERAAQDQRLVRRFVEQGHIETTQGNTLDMLHVGERLVEIVNTYDVQRIGFDRYNAAVPISRLEQEGVPELMLKMMPQNAGTYNAPLKYLLSCLLDGKFRHDGNPVLRWMAQNMAVTEDCNGNLKPHKGNSADKIDGMSAMLMGMALAIDEGATNVIYSTEGAGVILL